MDESSRFSNENSKNFKKIAYTKDSVSTIIANEKKIFMAYSFIQRLLIQKGVN